MLSLNTNSAVIQRNMTDMERKQLPYATMVAINDLAFQIRRAEMTEMKLVFNRPTPFVRKGIWVTKAENKRDPQAKVWINENNQGVYRDDDALPRILKPHIFGGQRQAKSSEKSWRRAGHLGQRQYTVAGRDMPKNRYGNLHNGEIQKMLAQTMSFSDDQQNTGRRRSRKKYFIATIKGTKGVWMRKGRRVIPALIFVNKARYKKRFDFFGVGDRIIKRYGDMAFANAMRKALRTAR